MKIFFCPVRSKEVSKNKLLASHAKTSNDFFSSSFKEGTFMTNPPKEKGVGLRLQKRGLELKFQKNRFFQWREPPETRDAGEAGEAGEAGDAVDVGGVRAIIGGEESGALHPTPQATKLKKAPQTLPKILEVALCASQWVRANKSLYFHVLFNLKLFPLPPAAYTCHSKEVPPPFMPQKNFVFVIFPNGFSGAPKRNKKIST